LRLAIRLREEIRACEPLRKIHQTHRLEAVEPASETVALNDRFSNPRRYEDRRAAGTLSALGQPVTNQTISTSSRACFVKAAIMRRVSTASAV
jgi:hypothetical protein